MCARAIGDLDRRGFMRLEDRPRQRHRLNGILARGAREIERQRIQVGEILVKSAALGSGQRSLRDVLLRKPSDRIVEEQELGMIEVVRDNGPWGGNSRLIHYPNPIRSEKRAGV